MTVLQRRRNWGVGGPWPPQYFTLETLLIFMLQRRSPRSRCILLSPPPPKKNGIASYAYVLELAAVALQSRWILNVCTFHLHEDIESLTRNEASAGQHHYNIRENAAASC